MDFDAHEIATYYRERAPKVPQRGKDWRGPCPVHNGDGDNFSVDPDTGMAYCFTQCGRGWDILGLEQDLTGANFPEAKLTVFRLVGRPDPPQREAEFDEAYDYTDEAGHLLFQSVRRYRGKRKNFILRRPFLTAADRGGWSWNMDGVVRVPYRLPKVVAADTILIPEGEKGRSHANGSATPLPAIARSGQIWPGTRQMVRGQGLYPSARQRCSRSRPRERWPLSLSGLASQCEDFGIAWAFLRRAT
ncbi:MAG: hypothetical protein IPM02_25845 [Betaproteobacteria bacterium]|nr:hypothetical protein [Betaproteobacteria bacterium]